VHIVCILMVSHMVVVLVEVGDVMAIMFVQCVRIKKGPLQTSPGGRLFEHKEHLT